MQERIARCWAVLAALALLSFAEPSQAQPVAAQPAAAPAAAQPSYGTSGYAASGQGVPAYGQGPASQARPYWLAGHGWVYPRYGYAPSPGYATPAYGQPHLADRPEAEDSREPSAFAFDLAAGTSFPLGLGPQLGVELPGRILLQVELAWMPAAYGSAVVGIIETFGEDRAILGKVVEDSLADSLVFRAGAGWRPIPSAGFELWLGYTTIAVSGTAPPDVIAGVVGGELHDRVEAELTEDIVVDAQLHNIHFGLGWRFLAADDHLVIRAAVGYTQTLGSTSSLDIAENRELEREAEPVFVEDLDEILRNDVKLPVLSLSLGYRF